MRSSLFIFFLIVSLAACLALAGCAAAPTAPVETATPTPTATLAPTSTPTYTPTPTRTPEPAWYQPLDPAYTVLEYQYGLVTDEYAELYLTLEDAVNQSVDRGYLPSVPAYVAIYSSVERDGRTFYSLTTGNWIAAEDLQLVTSTTFTGILLAVEVDFRFGWVLDETTSVNSADETIRTLPRYTVVHEFPSEVQRPGYVAIGINEWLPEEVLALVTPQTISQNMCRYIYVDLPEQTLSVYDGCRLAFATLISSGEDTRWTFAGNFAILYKVDYTTISAPNETLDDYYLQAVPNFMTYWNDLGFHAAYWHDDFGRPVSHGCINLSPGDAQWLYDWARLGDLVTISTGP
ncbi:MAG: L,D-transpeptidase [Anaerolineales bacterium]|nr:L,D-transpeptidase [Anaerolineales bacterium]